MQDDAVQDDAVRAARELWEAARDGDQAVLRVPDDARAADVRARVRRLAAEGGVRIRTARMGDGVAVVRLDASVWHEDAATMRRKLAVPEEPADG